MVRSYSTNAEMRYYSTTAEFLPEDQARLQKLRQQGPTPVPTPFSHASLNTARAWSQVWSEPCPVVRPARNL